MKITFKYNYTLLENGTVRTFSAGETVEFPSDSPMLETFKQQDGTVLTIEQETKKKQKMTASDYNLSVTKSVNKFLTR